jgi:hypothetical protein
MVICVSQARGQGGNVIPGILGMGSGGGNAGIVGILIFRLMPSSGSENEGMRGIGKGGGIAGIVGSLIGILILSPNSGSSKPKEGMRGIGIENAGIPGNRMLNGNANLHGPIEGIVRYSHSVRRLLPLSRH